MLCLAPGSPLEVGLSLSVFSSEVSCTEAQACSIGDSAEQRAEEGTQAASSVCRVGTCNTRIERRPDKGDVL